MNERTKCLTLTVYTRERLFEEEGEVFVPAGLPHIKPIVFSGRSGRVFRQPTPH